MMKKILFTILFLFLIIQMNAQYATPGTGVNWDLDDLMNNAPEGVLTFDGGIYTLTQNLTISEADQWTIDQSTILHIDPNVQITIAGSLIADADEITIAGSLIADADE